MMTLTPTQVRGALVASAAPLALHGDELATIARGVTRCELLLGRLGALLTRREHHRLVSARVVGLMRLRGALGAV